MLNYTSTNTGFHLVKDHFSKLSEAPVYIYSIHTGQQADQVYTSRSTVNLSRNGAAKVEISSR